MGGDYLQAYQTHIDVAEKIPSTKISKVSYLLKLKAQRNSLSDLDRKHKALGNKALIKYVILDGKEVDLTPAPERIKDPAGWRISSYSGKILKKNKT